MRKEKVIYNNEFDVYAYTIKNKEIELTALNFGASITTIKTKDKAGHMANIVADFKDPKAYLTCPDPYLNAIVGPLAGRISYGKYKLDGKLQQLSINNGLNHLHGGACGVSKKIWEVEEVIDENGVGLHFYLNTNHDEDGYHGMFMYDVYYYIKGNTLTIKYFCTPECKTILNMTSHLYFNLSGDLTDSIHNHMLQIPSSHKLKIHKDGYPYEIETIQKDSTFDFLKAKSIGDNYALGSSEYTLTIGYDTPFLLDEGKDIHLVDIQSGRHMQITTDQKSVVVYSANYFHESMILNKGHKGSPFCCIALETQDPANGINIDNIQSNCIFDKDHPYHQCTTYTFTLGEQL